jgi:hypothetical protein
MTTMANKPFQIALIVHSLEMIGRAGRAQPDNAASFSPTAAVS